MRTVLLSAAVSLLCALFGTPLAIRAFTRRGYGQEIRADGPAGHLSKRGTPTMGGTVIITASLAGYLVGHLATGDAVSASGLLVLFLMTGLGLVGFADDFIKLYMQRSLGLAGVADGLSTAVARSRWRMEVHRRGDGVTVINDAYNANPESVRAAVTALRHLAQDGRAFAILGHMAELGAISRDRHEDVGEFAARADLAGLIAVGSEAEPLLAGARRVRSWTGGALAVPDGAAALDALANQLKPGDVVLVKASRAAQLEGVAAALARGDDPPEPPAMLQEEADR